MFERLMNAEMSSEIVAHLLRRRWTLTRIARTIDAPVDFIRRVHDAKQSLGEPDLETLAAALKVPVYRLVFDSMRPERMSPKMRELYEATRVLMVDSQNLRQVLRRKPSRKRRTSAKAA